MTGNSNHNFAAEDLQLFKSKLFYRIAHWPLGNQSISEAFEIGKSLKQFGFGSIKRISILYP